jgi:hypothetical protein
MLQLFAYLLILAAYLCFGAAVLAVALNRTRLMRVIRGLRTM